MVHLPVWKKNVKKHPKRKVNISEPRDDKGRKIEASSLDLEKSFPERRVILISLERWLVYFTPREQVRWNLDLH